MFISYKKLIAIYYILISFPVIIGMLKTLSLVPLVIYLLILDLLLGIKCFEKKFDFDSDSDSDSDSGGEEYVTGILEHYVHKRTRK